MGTFASVYMALCSGSTKRIRSVLKQHLRTQLPVPELGPATYSSAKGERASAKRPGALLDGSHLPRASEQGALR